MAIEIILLFVVGFLPQDMNMAHQYHCLICIAPFRSMPSGKIKGKPLCHYTMCIGNLRSATEITCTGTAIRAKRTIGINVSATMESSAYLQ